MVIWLVGAKMYFLGKLVIMLAKGIIKLRLYFYILGHN